MEDGLRRLLSDHDRGAGNWCDGRGRRLVRYAATALARHWSACPPKPAAERLLQVGVEAAQRSFRHARGGVRLQTQGPAGPTNRLPIRALDGVGLVPDQQPAQTIEMLDELLAMQDPSLIEGLEGDERL